MHFFANFEKVCMKNILTEFVPVLGQLRKLVLMNVLLELMDLNVEN